jgi:predicted transcriptional regulator
MRIRPYASARVIEARFTSAAAQGFLAVNSKNEYLCTEKGTKFAEQVTRSGEEAIARLEPVPAVTLQKILDYAKRLVQATFDTPEPPSRFAMMRYYKNVHPVEETSLLHLLLHLGTLDQYRGAAHIASWESHNLKGYEWSAFTSIWRNEANTLDALHEEMGAIVFTRDEISEALHALSARGWIEENAGIYQVTDEGKQIREEAEALTDKSFFAPWSCLNESELEELASLASRLRDGLKK